MFEEKREIRWKPIALAVCVALLVHLQLLLTDLLPSMYRYWNDMFPRFQVEQPTEVTMIAMTQRQFEQNRQLGVKAKVEKEKAPDADPVPEPEKDKAPDRPKGQVVDVAPTPDSSPPKDARFLSEHNTNVKKETVSRKQRADYGVAQPKPTMANSQARRPSDPQPQPGKDRVALVTQKRGDRKSEAKADSFVFEIPDLKKRDALDLKLDLSMGELATYKASEAMRGNSKRLRIQRGDAASGDQSDGGDRGQDERTVAMFAKPTMDELDMVSGAPANDHIEDVPKGEATLLNSREFKYATFFNRVKRGVSQYWSPRVGEEYRRRDPYGNIYGVKDRRTLLNVALDSEGELLDVEVSKSSGVQFFDDVAVRSFREASPFPNPPLGLLEPDGQIHFQFGFYFMIGERPTIRAFQFNRSPY